MVNPRDLRGAHSNALGWNIGLEVLLTPSRSDIVGFTVMIQVTNSLGARACSHLLNGSTGRMVVSNKRDELVGSGIKIQ